MAAKRCSAYKQRTATFIVQFKTALGRTALKPPTVPLAFATKSPTCAQAAVCARMTPSPTLPMLTRCTRCAPVRVSLIHVGTMGPAKAWKMGTSASATLALQGIVVKLGTAIREGKSVHLMISAVLTAVLKNMDTLCVLTFVNKRESCVPVTRSAVLKAVPINMEETCTVKTKHVYTKKVLLHKKKQTHTTSDNGR